jgi:hypothetical protein
VRTGNGEEERFVAFLCKKSEKEWSFWKIMTEEAREILNQMRERGRRRRILARLKDPRQRSTTMESINRMDQDETPQVGGGDQEMKVLSEMNELQEFENENWTPNGCI